MRRVMFPLLFVFAAIAAVATWASWSDAQHRNDPIRGIARAIDGDTIVIGRTHIRLYGIDAPELGQPCMREGGAAWPCGDVAGETLDRLLADQPLVCEPNRQHPTDAYNRTIALCVTDRGDDVGRWMVTNGWAVAYVRYSDAYVVQEAEARDRRLGIWSGSFEQPWLWGKGHPK